MTLLEPAEVIEYVGIFHIKTQEFSFDASFFVASSKLNWCMCDTWHHTWQFPKRESNGCRNNPIDQEMNDFLFVFVQLLMER